MEYEETDGKILIWNFIILMAIGIIVTMGYMIINEYYGAKNSCEETGGEFEYEFPSNYYCNNKPFFKFNDGWDYEKEFNISELNLSNLILP